MNQNARDMIAFPVIFVILSLAVQAYLMEGFYARRSGDFGEWNRIVRGEINADILITGASRAQAGMDVSLLEEDLNKDVYNIALLGNSLALQVARLKVYLKYNRPPEAIVQVVGRNTLRKPRAYNPGQFIPYLNEKEIYQTLSGISKHFILARYFPLYSFALLSHDFTVDAVQGLTGREDTVDCYKGYCPVNIDWNKEEDVKTVKRLYPQGLKGQMTEEGKAALNELVQLCRQKRIRLFFVYAPVYYQFNEFVVNLDEVRAIYRKLSDGRDIVFMDYSSAEMARQEKYFYNSQHLNQLGSIEFSKIFGPELKQLLTRIEEN